MIQDDPTRAFEWHSGHLHDLGVLPHHYNSIATSINDKGQIVGASYGSFDDGHAVLWQSGKMEDLGTLPGYPYSTATCINNQGQIVGNCTGKGTDRYLEVVAHAFVWHNKRMQALEALGGQYSYAFAINDRGQIVGKADLPARVYYVPPDNIKQPGMTHPCLWLAGAVQPQDLGTLPDDGRGFASGINTKGQVTGISTTDISCHAFLWQDSKMVSLGNFSGSGDIVQATGINNRGQIVGNWHSMDDNTEHAFVWQNGTGESLDALIAPQSGWALKDAAGINNRGQIVGSGTHNGKPRAFLLTPRTK